MELREAELPSEAANDLDAQLGVDDRMSSVPSFHASR
jgi:hypothetical protein